MVFPSLRCLTCKGRRVKCDETRPICTRCLKACRTCTWESDGETSLPFRSENAFAQGQLRRPRKQTSKTSPRSSSTLLLPVSRALALPVEDHAFNYWVQNFTTWPNSLQDIGKEPGPIVLGLWKRVSPDSSLHLALSSFLLALFGKARCAGEALQNAEKVYASSVIHARRELMELSSESIDQLLVAVFLMSSYDTIMHQVGGQNYHIKGAAGLLLAKQQRGCAQDQPLERAIRRSIIRTCVMEGEAVPEWLQDGVSYGEEGPVLSLDSLTVAAAAFRFKCRQLLSGVSSKVEIFSRIDSLKGAAAKIQELDYAFEAWSQYIPPEWKCSTYHPSMEMRAPENLFGSYFHSYTTLDHAATWIRYGAVYLIVLNIRIQLLSALADCVPLEASTKSQLEASKNKISSVATDLCLSVLGFFKSHRNIYDNSEFGVGEIITSTELEIEPQMTAIVAWPLMVAITIEYIDQPQKRWLQQLLKVTAGVIGVCCPPLPG